MPERSPNGRDPPAMSRVTVWRAIRRKPRRHGSHLALRHARPAPLPTLDQEVPDQLKKFLKSGCALSDIEGGTPRRARPTRRPLPTSDALQVESHQPHLVSRQVIKATSLQADEGGLGFGSRGEAVSAAPLLSHAPYFQVGPLLATMFCRAPDFSDARPLAFAWYYARPKR
jgi:hypothetical protein